MVRSLSINKLELSKTCFFLLNTNIVSQVLNSYCCDNEAFSPVINHEVEFHHSFEMCKP